MIRLEIENAVTHEIEFSKLVIPQFTRLERQGIIGPVNLVYGFANKTAVNVANIIYDSRQGFSVTAKSKDYVLTLTNQTLTNSNFNKPNCLESTSTNPKTSNIVVIIEEKSGEVVRANELRKLIYHLLKNKDIVQIEENEFGEKWESIDLIEAEQHDEGRKLIELLKTNEKNRRGKVVRRYESRFVDRKWEPIELFKAIEGYDFDNKEVWCVFELMRDNEQIIEFKMESKDHLLTIFDFDNRPDPADI